MKFHIAPTTANFLLPALCILSVATANAAKPAPTENSPADEVLRQMSSRLAGAREFSFEAHRTIDPALVPGRELPTDAQISVTVQRPNKVFARSRGKGDERDFYADGRRLSLVDVTKNVYATASMPATLDGLVAEVERKYGFTPPLGELVLSDVYQDIRWKTQRISDLGTARAPGGFLGIGGVPCHRVALSGRMIDAELWVGVDDHLPRRLIATAKDRPGKPRITIAFSHWNLAARTADQDFVFVPPKGATQIPMRTTAEMPAVHSKHHTHTHP